MNIVSEKKPVLRARFYHDARSSADFCREREKKLYKSKVLTIFVKKI